ncbi:MAG: hypothetical protein C0391_00395 [Anaerolinea sp.]|nr:hypothetical protein [Anaerolinea sp.]
MTLFLSKLLPLFIYPVGLAGLLLLMALVLWKKTNLTRFFVLIAFLAIFVGGNRWVSMSIVRSLESRYAPLAENIHGDVIVVLGGGTDPQQYPRPTVEVNGAGDRIFYAASLYRLGVADQVILTGGNIEWQGEVSSTPAEDMAVLMRFSGVPSDALILQGESANTAEDAAFSAQIIKENGWQRVILVTSALHMPRSVALFKEMGVEVIPAPTDFIITDQAYADLFSSRWENIAINLLPTASSLKSTTSALKEYIGMLVNTIGD